MFVVYWFTTCIPSAPTTFREETPPTTRQEAPSSSKQDVSRPVIYGVDVPLVNPKEAERREEPGWECPACTVVNLPHRPGCEVCYLMSTSALYSLVKQSMVSMKCEVVIKINLAMSSIT